MTTKIPTAALDRKAEMLAKYDRWLKRAKKVLA